MVWYNPGTWFSAAPTDTVETGAYSEPAVAPGPYGARRRKTRRGKKVRGGSKRARTGKKSSRS